MRIPRLLTLAACTVCAASGLLGLGFYLVLSYQSKCNIKIDDTDFKITPPKQ